VDTTKTITHLSLCSGYEGIGLGLRRVLPNLREIAYVEIEAFAIANLVAKMEAQHLDPAPIFTDLKTFPYEQFRGKVDILSGGFPCQPFSAAGQRKATDDPRHLFPFIADGIQKCQPRIVFLENVQGILSCKTGDGEPVLQYVLRELEQMGYRATAGIFSAEEVGAPHQRKRVFILGMVNSDSRRCSPSEQPRSSSEEISGGQINIEPSSGSPKLANAYNDGHRENRGGDKEEDSVPEEYRQEVRGGMLDRTSKELVNTNSNGHSEHSATQKEESVRGTETTTMPRSNETPELANTCSKGSQGSELSQALHRETKAQYSTSQCSNDERSGQTPELANSESEGLEGHSGLRSKQDRGCEFTSQGLWPSRPSQAQYEWEEPRVVTPRTSQAMSAKITENLVNRQKANLEEQQGKESEEAD
jgi:DNA-cytosine methyltransferase